MSDHMAIFAALHFKVNKTFNQIELENINWPDVFDQGVRTDSPTTYDQQISTKLDELINRNFPSKVVEFNKYEHKKSKRINYDLR